MREAEGEEGYQPPDRTYAQIESDAFAFDVDRWEGMDVSGALRLEAFLRNKFAGLLSDERHKYVTLDSLTTIGQLAMGVATEGVNVANPNVRNAIRSQLKRLLIMEKSASGHNTAYIGQFAAAIDHAEMPSWVVNAEKQAAAVLKGTQVTHSRGGGGSRGGRGRGGRGGQPTPPKNP